jgi:hypothetical protein
MSFLLLTPCRLPVGARRLPRVESGEQCASVREGRLSQCERRTDVGLPDRTSIRAGFKFGRIHVRSLA